MKRLSFHHDHNHNCHDCHHQHHHNHHDHDHHNQNINHHDHVDDQAKVQLLGVARRNGASLGDETLDSLIATNIQVGHHNHDNDHDHDDHGEISLG